MTRFDRDFLQSIDLLPSKFGTIREKYLAQDAKHFVLIFQDIPENWSVRWSIGEALYFFRDVNLFCRDGAWGTIDTSLPYTIPKDNIRRETTIYFLWKLLIAPAEYAHILRGGQDRTIVLFGVEDKGLYRRATKTLSNQSKFLKLQIDRARAIVKNLLKKMAALKRPISILTCCGDLPDLVSEELERVGVSYAVITPKMHYPSDKELYAKRMAGQIPSYEDIFEDMDKLPEIPTRDTDFQDKKQEEMKEQARIQLNELIKSGELLSKFKNVLTYFQNKKLKKILSSSEYGPKSKAVLINSELYSAMKPLMNPRSTAISTRLYLISLALIILILFFNLGPLFNWLYKAIIVLLSTGFIHSTLTKRYAFAFRWILHLIGFYYGFHYFGKKGIFLSSLIAAILGYFLVIKKQRRLKIRINLINKILIGKLN
jgi:hypothetical protein